MYVSKIIYKPKTTLIMKNKFKFLIASVSIAMLFLSSCEKEIYDDAIYKSQQPQNLSISKISFKELKSNKNAVEKIKRVMTKKLPTSIANRAVYNEDFGVLIDTTNIVQMTSTTEQSITFNIVDYTDSTKKENLVLVSKNDGNFEAYIAEYNLTQQDLDILASGGTLENLKPTNISEIENASKIAVSGSCVSTSSSTEFICNPSNGGESYSFGFSYSGGCNGTMTYLIHNIVSIDYSCISQGGGSLYTGSGISSESSGSGSNSSSGSGYSGGSGYNGSFSGNYINTTFVPCTSCIEFTETLSDFLEDLTPDQLEYWNDLSPREQQTIVDYLEQPGADPAFAEELIDLAILEPNQDDVYKITKLSIMFETSEDIFSEEFGQSLLPFTEINPSHIPPDYPITNLTISTFLKYKQLRQLNPDWSRAKCLWYATKEMVHIGLDVFGMCPLFGEPADVLNGVLYTIEGDGLNATLSYAGAVPLTGWAATGVKYAIKINEVSTLGSKVKLVWKVAAGGVIQFGSRGQLRKVLGLLPGNPLQAHHIIPWNKQSKEIVQKAAKSGNAFHMNEALNGIPLSTAAHNGSHANYDNVIQIKFNQFKLSNPDATPDECYNFLVDLINDIRTWILNNPNVPINNIVLP